MSGWPTCACGCGEPVPAVQRNVPQRGYVKGAPHKYVNGHQHKGKPDHTPVDCGFETPCWVWRHAGGVGYGTARVNGKTVNAHRLIYEQAHGPIPTGLDLDHLCRNRRCVNPDHLEPVTRRENALRGAKCNKELAA